MYENDIPLSVAQAAHEGTSFVPERRAESERSEYQKQLEADHAELSALADTDEKRELLAQEFERYREGCRAKTLAWLHARGRMISPIITGPARFPVRQQEKRANTAHKRLGELIEYRRRALAAIRKKLCPEIAPIMSGDSDAIERLQAKISEAEALQERMKSVNKAHKAFAKNPASLDKSGLSDADKDLVRHYKPAYSWEPHPFPPYRLQNNNANIRRMRERIKDIEKTQAMPDTSSEGTAATIEDCPAENRIRLFFPGKPAAEIRQRLKSNGFRWTPSLGCWQAYRNHRAAEVAQEIAAG